MKAKIQERIIQIESDIANEISEKHYKDIIETVKDLGGDEHSLNGNGRKKNVEFIEEKISQMFTCCSCGEKE